MLPIHALVLAASSLQSSDARAAPIDARGVSVALARIASEHPTLATVLPVAESRGGRKVEALRLAAGERAPGRPAILVVANVEGPWSWTTGLALDEARELAARYASDAGVKALLDGTTLYIVPCANPDAAEARFGTPLREERAGAAWMDDDRDGRAGEDGPSDVDGDGKILTLRKLDPEGEWIADPADARAMVKADRAKGERGQWKLWVEGRDSDGDEKVGEDPSADVQVGRNFAHGWREHAPEAGPWAMCEPEARGLADFVLAHRDVQMVVVYGAQDDLQEKPRTMPDEGGRGALTGVPETDAKLYVELGKRYKDLVGAKAKGDGDDHGSFQAWCRFQRGLFTVSIAPWSLPLDQEAPKSEEQHKDEKPADERAAGEKAAGEKAAGDKAAGDKSSGEKKAEKKKDEPSDDAKRLRWIDAKNESARFVAWKAFQHSELGAVEIGGFAPYASIEPPESERAKIADDQRAFLASLGGSLARVHVVDAKAKDLGGVWEVKAALEDAAWLPLTTVAGRRTGAPRPARVTLKLPASAKLVAGEKQTLVRELAGSGGRKELEWLVLGAAPSSIEIELDTDNAGAERVSPAITK
ncbi:MAG: hypothetical protein HZA53_06845 [Planctomycetes bacterium]|nr:hypothetical protein [Planctomycetota bacterium]